MAIDKESRYTWDGQVRKITFQEALNDIARLKFAGFECTDNDVEVYHSSVKEFREIVRMSGIEFVSAWSTLFPKRLDPSFRATIDPGLPMSDPRQYQPISISSIGRDDEEGEIERQIQYANLVSAMGAKLLTVGGPYMVRGDIRDGYYRFMGDVLNATGDEMEKSGMRIAYHPEVGTLVQETDDLERLFDYADKKLVGLCLEPAHLVAAGDSPVEFVKRYGARIIHAHMKDLANGMFAELGTGVVDLEGIVKAFNDFWYAGWLVAELDIPSRTPLESAKSNKHYLDGLLRNEPR